MRITAIVCGVLLGAFLVAAGCWTLQRTVPASAAEPRVGTIVPLPETLPPVAQAVPLGELATGLRTYLALDGHLLSVDADGLEARATFARNSPVYLPDLQRVEKDVPRYFPGKYGKSIFIEYTHRWIATNQLPATVAQAENAPAGFTAVGQGTLAKGAGCEGAAGVQLEAKAAGDGFCTQPVSAAMHPVMTYSAYVKGAKDASLTLTVTMEGQDAPLASTPVTLSGAWERVFVTFNVPKPAAPPAAQPPKDKTFPLQCAFTLDAPGTLLADAFMLESHQGYGGRKVASSWVPGETLRDGEILSLPAPVNVRTGTLAFWASRTGDLAWRCLLCIDNSHGWNPDLRLDLRNNTRLELALPEKVSGRKDLPALQEGAWHHFAVAWDGPTVVVYVDGVEQIKVTNAPARTAMGRINIGGVATNFSPAARSDMFIDEFAQWDRTLTAAEVATLAERAAPIGAGLQQALTIADREPVQVFARDALSRDWPLAISNRGKAALNDLTLTYGIPQVFERKVSLTATPAGTRCEAPLAWPPAFVQPGTYTMRFTLTGTGVSRTFTRPIEIVAARPPASNAQVVNWGGNTPELAGLGITSAGIDGVADGPYPHDLAAAVRNGLYVQMRHFLQGESDRPEDKFVDCAGNPGGVDQRSPAAVADIQAKARRLAEGLSVMPDVRQTIMNSEHQWIGYMDFRPATMAMVKERFGLDLEPWSKATAANAGAFVHPGARLSAKAGKYAAPADGIVPLNDPFYAYHRWWHSDQAGTEVYLNDAIAQVVRARAPWVRFMCEPVLRRPPVRVFKEQDIIEEWFYYPNPNTAMWVMESTAAAARGTKSIPHGMPQFLLKPGMAAPYGGLPTPDMYREATWHCIARPSGGLTYWNLWGAITRSAEKNVVTQPEIDAILGPTPTYEAAKAKIEVKGEWSSVYLFIPELRDEISRLHNEVVHPLGALLPAWQNRPRKLAVYRSFAGSLFNEIRWQGNDPLSSAVERVGVPFDVLYDQDFEEFPKLLDRYEAVAIPESPVITEPAAKALKAFIARGGVVVVDDYFKPQLDGMVQLKWAGANDSAAAELLKIEQQLLKQYGRPDHPQFIEGMEQAAKQFANSEGPTTKAIFTLSAALHPEVRARGLHVCTNLLQAEGATYLTAVNDLRVPGKYYGHFGRVRDEGVAQPAEFEMDPALGKVAYALLSCQPVPLTPSGKRAVFKLDLPAAGGRVLVFLPEKIKSMAAVVTNTPVRGALATCSGILTGESGKPVPGIIPARVTITNPDGSRHDFSRHMAFVNGRWSYEIPIAYNAPAGTYKLEVRELASGLTSRGQWVLAP